METFTDPMQMVNSVCDKLMADHFGDVADQPRKPVKRPPSRFGAVIDLEDLDVDVVALWEPGFPGDRETPDEPPFWDIHAVFLSGTTVDITAVVGEQQLERIREQIEDQ